MKVRLFEDRRTMSEATARHAAASLRQAIERNGTARLVAATGTSQLAFLHALTADATVSWPAVELFHLDEYIGLPATHPASFRRYITEHLIRRTGIARFHLLDGEADPARVCREVGAALCVAPIDVAFAGIGENGHLAFNDPPADFATDDSYITVRLDEACRRQQVGEGWFEALEDVPIRALSMSIRQILSALEILVIVSDQRKAEAVRATLEGSVTPFVPASILQTHGNATLFLDTAAASRLAPATRERYEI